MYNPVIPAGMQNFVIVIGPPPVSNVGQNTAMMKQHNNPMLIIRPKPGVPVHSVSHMSQISPVLTPNTNSPLVDPLKIPFTDCSTTVPGINGRYKCFFAVLVKIFGLAQVLEAFYQLGGDELFKGDAYFTASNETHIVFAKKLADHPNFKATFGIYVKYTKGWTRSPIITFGTGKNFVPFGLFPGDHKVLGHFVHIDNVSELDITANPQQLQREIFDFFLGCPEDNVSDIPDTRFDEALVEMLKINPSLDLGAARLGLETKEKEKELVAKRKKQEADDLTYASQLQIESDNAYVVEKLTANPQADIGQVLAQLQQMKS